MANQVGCLSSLNEGPISYNISSSGKNPILEKDPVIALIFDKYLSQGKSQNFGITSQSTGVSDCAEDHSYISRIAIVDLPFSLSENPSAISPLFANSLNNPSGGITTGFDMVTGAVIVNNAYHRALITGKTESWLDLIRGLGQTLAGASYLGLRGTSMAATITGVDTTAQAASVLGRAVYWLGFIGNILFGLLYLAQGLMSVANLYNLNKLQMKMGDSPIQYLQKRLDVTESQVREKFFKNNTFLDSDETWNKELKREALSAGTEGLKKLGIENGAALLNQICDQQGLLEQIGLQIKISKLSEKRATKLINLIGQDNITRLKIENITPEMSIEFTENIKRAIKINKVINSILLFAAMTGLAATILSFVFTAGLGAVVVSGILLLSVIGMFLTESYSLKKSLESSDIPGSHDFKIVKGHLGFTSTGFILGLGLTLGFGLPLTPLFILGFIAIGVIALDIYSLSKISEKRQSALLQRPTMEFVKEMFERGEISEDLTENDIRQIARHLHLENIDTLASLREEVNRYFEQINQDRENILKDLKLITN